MTASEFFGLYKALNATAERVLGLIEEPAAMNSAEKRLISYLISYVSNSRQDDLRLLLQFVTGSSVLLGESIQVVFNNTEGLARSPTAKTCSCTIELPYHTLHTPSLNRNCRKSFQVKVPGQWTLSRTLNCDLATRLTSYITGHLWFHFIISLYHIYHLLLYAVNTFKHLMSP